VLWRSALGTLPRVERVAKLGRAAVRSLGTSVWLSSEKIRETAVSQVVPASAAVGPCVHPVELGIGKLV
jgi:hypothetical protein